MRELRAGWGLGGGGVLWGHSLNARGVHQLQGLVQLQERLEVWGGAGGEDGGGWILGGGGLEGGDSGSR